MPPADKHPRDAGVHPDIFPPGIVPDPEPESNAVLLADQFHDSMKGVGTRDDDLIKCVACHTRQERVNAAFEFDKKYKERLADWIRGDTSFWYQKTLLRLCAPRDEMLAFMVFDATDGFGTKDEALIDVITQFYTEIPRYVEAYSRLYHVGLKDAIIGDCSGDYRKLLVCCLDAQRPAPGTIMPEEIENDARALYDAGEGVVGTKEDVFIRVFTERSPEHLQAVNEAYVKYSPKKRNLEQAIISETSGKFRQALIAMMTPQVTHFAQRIYEAMKGLSTKDTVLVNSFCALERPVLRAVQAKYEELYKGHKLADDVKKDTSGDYCKLLLALLNPPA